MKLGIKEFRERLSKLAHGREPVVVTHHGKVLGRFVPEGLGRMPIDRVIWEREMAELRDRWKAQMPDWQDRLASIGLDPDGEPLAR